MQTSIKANDTVKAKAGTYLQHVTGSNHFIVADVFKGFAVIDGKYFGEKLNRMIELQLLEKVH